MNKVFPLLFFCLLNLALQAQQTIPVYEKYGKFDTADLEMKDCDFEPGANAEILFDKGVFVNNFLEQHKRVKIFKSAGLSVANVRLVIFSTTSASISAFKAETINLTDGKIEITPVDKKQVYFEKIDNFSSALVFAFPNVRPGSIIEYQYSISFWQDWYFQNTIPTRYSEIQVSINSVDDLKLIPHVNQPFSKDVGGPYDLYQDKVLYNVHSAPDEPFMGAKQDNMERLELINNNSKLRSWQAIGLTFLKYGFGGQFDRSLTNEKQIIDQAKNIKSQDEKISFIYDQVKNSMKWNNITSFLTIDGTVNAWDKKTGNSAEINLILYRLLKKSGITAYPMTISTKEHGKINPFNVNPFCFNNTVVYIPVDTTDVNNPKYYVLDATNKFNLFNKVPEDELNTFGLVFNTDDNDYKMKFLQNTKPVTQSVFLNAEIEPGGKMSGTAEISDYDYYKVKELTKYTTDGEKKFIDYLKNDNNNLTISNLQLQNTDIDTLPLVKNLNFTLDLAGSDENYIYFNPNLFITPHQNPFINETRYNDVDFGYHNRVLISGIFKLPAGYHIEAIPKSTIILMPDSSITLKRIINEQDGAIVLRYSIIFTKTLYAKGDYSNLREFYKKMYEMLNEQIVLKKS
jgi:hypothetical protein